MSGQPVGPYRGLTPYGAEDAPFFFGRDAEGEIITANLIASRFTVLYGPSGVGKSSVLRAGVEHRVRELIEDNVARRGRPKLAVVVFAAWHDDPVAGLIQAIHQAIGEVRPGSFDPPRAQDGLASALAASAGEVDGDLLIVLDQFEEHFLYHPESSERDSFDRQLPEAIDRTDLRANFLVSIREDSLARLDRFKGRIPGLFSNSLRLDHLDLAAARRAIEGPVEQYNLVHASGNGHFEVEPELVAEVLGQLAPLAGLGLAVDQLPSAGRVFPADSTRVETPLLQLVMTRLWAEEMASGSHHLRRSTLDSLGGARRIVLTHLDHAMAGLQRKQTRIASAVFRYLVTPSGTKIAHSVSDLADYADVRERDLAPVMENLSRPDLRVLKPIAPPPERPDVKRYEIFHDVLSGPILDWRARYVRRRARYRNAGILALLLLLVGAAAGAFVLTRPKPIVMGSVLRVGFDQPGNQIYTVSVDGLARIWDAETGRLRATLRPGAGDVTTAAFSRDGRQAVTVTDQGQATIWETRSGTVMRTLGSSIAGQVSDAVFSKSGGRLITAGDRGLVSWHPESGGGKPLEDKTPTAAEMVKINGSGDLVVAIDPKNTKIWRWPVEAGPVPLRPLIVQVGPIRNGKFSPVQDMLVTISKDGAVAIWDATTGYLLHRLPRSGEGQANDATFDPDGQLVATAGRDGTAVVWDVETGIERRRYPSPAGSSPLIGIAWTGRFVVTVNEEGAAFIWERGQSPYRLGGDDTRVNWVAFSLRAGELLTGDDDGTARLWDLAARKQILELGTPTS